MIKKLILISIPILVVLALVVILLVVNRRQPLEWKASLDQYINYLLITDQKSYRILSTSPASYPGNFSVEMSAESFSESVIFQSSLNTSSEYSASLLPIPYPPIEVVCALVTHGDMKQVVFVALHDSLYNADWIVHISSDPWDSPTLKLSLVSLGCNLSD